MDIIKIENLTRDYGNSKGIFNVSFSVKEGEVFGFLGPNGAGKTTTIRHLMGFIKPLKGYCSILGYDCFTKSSIIQKELGYIPGEIAFFDDMTGIEYINFIGKYRNADFKSKSKDLLDRFELNPTGKIKKMSKGMKQKIGIVTAFMHNPKVLILDEPTSGLDPLMQNRFINLIEEEKKAGKTILMSSHIFEEVEKTCDSIGIIKDGKIIALENASDLTLRHTKVYEVALKDNETARKFAKDFNGILDINNPLLVKVSTKETLENIFMDCYDTQNNQNGD